MDRRPTEATLVPNRIIDLALAKLSEVLNVTCRDGVVSADGVDNDETELEDAVRQGLNSMNIKILNKGKD